MNAAKETSALCCIRNSEFHPKKDEDMTNWSASNNSDPKRQFDLIALIFATVFALLPWEQAWISATGMPFVDKSVYLTLFENTEQFVNYRPYDTLSSLIADEALWNFGVNFLFNIGLSPDALFLAITFLCVFSFSLLIVRNSSPAYLALLVNPLIVDLSCSQFRIALAASLLCFGLLSNTAWLKWPLIGCTPMIHTAALSLIALFLLCKFVTRPPVNGKPHYSRFAVCLLMLTAGMALAVVLGPLKQDVLTAVEDRRSLVEEEMVSSLTFNSFWMFLLGAALIASEKLTTSAYCAFATTLLATVTAGTFMEVYTSRLLAVCFPTLVLLIASIRREVRGPVLLAFGAYAIVQWYYWLRG